MTNQQTIVKSAPGTESTESAEVSAFDFRAPDKFPRSFIQHMTELHATFGRNLAERLGRELRSNVTIEQIGVEQLTYDGYVRSMPNPSILSTIDLTTRGENIIFEMGPQLGLMLVDRLLGGSGKPVPPRRLTELEQSILASMLAHPLTALADTLNGVIETSPTIVDTELNPQFVHVAAPTEMVLVLTFTMVAESDGPSTRGLISLCYPLSVLGPIREAIRRATWTGTLEDTEPSEAMASIVNTSSVEVIVSTDVSGIPAHALTDLQVGDVVTLDQTVDQPLILSIDKHPLAECRLGRQGPYLAAQLESWLR